MNFAASILLLYLACEGSNEGIYKRRRSTCAKPSKNSNFSEKKIFSNDVATYIGGFMELENTNKMSLIGVQWSGLKIHETLIENYYPEMKLVDKTWEDIFATFIVNTPDCEDEFFKNVKRIAVGHVDYKVRYPGERTPLLIACQFSHVRKRIGGIISDRFVNGEIISTLLERGANPDDVDERGISPMHAVAISGDVAGCKALLDKGANTYVYDKSKCTPFKYAASSGNSVEVLKMLVRCKPCENVGKFYSDALEFIKGWRNRWDEKEILWKALQMVKRKKESQ